MNVAPNYPCNRLNKCQLFVFQLFLPITAGSDLMQLEDNTDNHYSLQSVKIISLHYCGLLSLRTDHVLPMTLKKKRKAGFIIIREILGKRGGAQGQLGVVYLVNSSQSRACFLQEGAFSVEGKSCHLKKRAVLHARLFPPSDKNTC